MYHMYVKGEKVELALLDDLPADLQPLAAIIEQEATAKRPRRLRVWIGNRENPVEQRFPSITGYFSQDDGWKPTSITRYTVNSKKCWPIVLSEIVAISTTRLNKAFVYKVDGFTPIEMTMATNPNQKLVTVTNPATGQVLLRMPFGKYRSESATEDIAYEFCRYCKGELDLIPNSVFVEAAVRSAQ